ncbi:MAG: hypothetical protein ABGW69_03460 [Nanoarchaeota archaeon]
MLKEFNNLVVDIKNYISFGNEESLKEIKEKYRSLQEKLKNYTLEPHKNFVKGVLDKVLLQSGLKANIKGRKGENLEMRLTRAILEPPTENHLNDVIKYEVVVEGDKEKLENLAYQILDLFKDLAYGFRVNPDREGRIYLEDLTRNKDLIIRKDKWKIEFWPPELIDELKSKSSYITAQLTEIKDSLETFLENYYGPRVDDLLPETNKYGAKYKAIHLELALKEDEDFVPLQIQLYTEKDLKEIYEKLPYEVYLKMRENHLRFLLNKQYNQEEKKRIQKLVKTLNLDYLKKLTKNKQSFL